MTSDLLVSLLGHVAAEEADHARTIHLAANENLLSLVAREFLRSPLCCRHHEGLLETRKIDGKLVEINNFSFRSLSDIYEIEKIAHEKINHQLRSVSTELRLSSGMHAMITTILCATELNDLVLSIKPEDGGHSATKFVLERSGRRHEFIPWDNEKIDIDYDGLSRLAADLDVSAIYLDQGTPLYPIGLAKLRDIVGDDTTLVYDASHTLGLIAAGHFQSPLSEGADLLQGNTHKTYPGPQKGLVSFKTSDWSERYQTRVSSGLVSNQQTHHLLALFTGIFEMERFGASFAGQMIANARILTDSLLLRGVKIVSRAGEAPCSHQVLIEFSDVNENQRVAGDLEAIGISTNARIAFRRAVIRIGVQEVTRRGMQDNEMVELADIIVTSMRGGSPHSILRDRARALSESFQECRYSFDESPVVG